MGSSEHKREQSVERFLEMIRSSRKGKFKIYIGMAAGVGKTYRMLQEAHQLYSCGIDIAIGIIETHGRKDTAKLLEGLPELPKKKVFYKGKSLEEMDIEAILIRKPEIVLVDELAHTNIPGSINSKRWEDVLQLIDSGISVISTVNIQHIESINKEVEKIASVEIRERVPDSVLQMADEVVNIDLTISDLIKRLEEGKIYDMAKIPIARNNFFQEGRLLQLRELALREVTRQVGRKINKELLISTQKSNAVLTCLSSNSTSGANLIRHSSRLASMYDFKWYVLYVQTPGESPETINGTDQRCLIDNFRLATDLEAEVVKLKSKRIAETIIDFAKQKEVGLIIAGKSESGFWNKFLKKDVLNDLIKLTHRNSIDILIISSHE
ncbi:MAG: sensor histidine kinase KdpD [Syntrophothermus sp.]